jgi:Ca-activated chloride channel family protein
MRALALAVFVCVSAALLPAAVVQPATGIVSGTVKDAAGAAIPGATVVLSTPASTPHRTVSGKQGEFKFENVPAGAYRLMVSLQGFSQYTAAVSVKAGATATIAVVLRVAGLEESVRVEAAAPVASPSAKRAVAGVAGGVVGGVVGGVAGPPPPFNTEAYDRIEDNAFRLVTQNPLSTFSIDVDTASYSNVRRFLNDGQLPPPDAVRVEEMINYFRYDYGTPANDVPFAVTTELAECPWNAKHRLALVGLQARPMDAAAVPDRNLVFLIDVSGSMMPANKLPLVRTAMRMLVDTLTPRDRVAIVVYAGASGLVLPSTTGERKERIHDAIARLEAGGSTNGGAGIALAYRIAQEHFVKEGINRVILATDGDFNVGVTNQGELTRLIEEKRAGGVFLSVLGVGTGNLKDSTMEKLADRGNGNYAYLDSLHEARKVLVAEGGATLVTVAKDVKIQVEFNPAQVTAYRLVGYENRLLRNEDFNNDLKDAGEVGAGHTVTALYEIVPAGETLDVPTVDPLKYQRPATPRQGAAADELMTVKVRYKAPDGDTSRLLSFPVKARVGETSPNVGFAAAVAEFGMLLRKSEHKGTSSFADAAALARKHRGGDADGYRAEFVRLVEIAESLARFGTR